MKNNNTLVFLVLLGLLVALGVYCAWGKKHDSNKNESYSNAKSVSSESSKSDIEYLPNPDTGDDGFELLGVAPEEPAFQLGFGMGPGLYGSGRHTSEMFG